MKRILSKLNTLAAVLLALILVLMINYLALRNPLRLNWSGRAYYELSPKSLNLLSELENRVDVIVLFQEEHPLYHDIENLLEEYQYHSRNITIEWVDPARDLARTEQLAGKYGLKEAQVVVFDIGDRVKVVKQSELAEYQMVKGRKEPVMTGFKAEQAFSSAIQGLLQDKTPKVYFLVGHGERRAGNVDPVAGYSKIGAVVTRDNLEAAELILSAEQRVPEDAAALVVAGPSTVMSQTEIEMIEEYLNRSGRVLMLLDALKPTGLEPMLQRWGVGLRNDYVVDLENTLRGSDVHVRRYTAHPISAQMDSIVQFILPRSVVPLQAELDRKPAEDQPSVEVLLQTSEKSWSEMQVEDTNAQYNPGTADQPGPLSLAVAVERGAAQTVLDVQIKPTRMVVIGDSDFVSNGGLVGGNQDLFMNALNWVLDREELMAIAPKPIEEVRLSLSRRQLRTLSWITVGGIPALAVIGGILVWLQRRK